MEKMDEKERKESEIIEGIRYVQRERETVFQSDTLSHTHTHISKHSMTLSPDTRVSKRGCWQWHCAVNDVVSKGRK